jgi:hypothetical protein
MTPSQAKALAREVLEDDFVLPYFSTEQLAMMKTLEQSICPRDPPLNQTQRQIQKQIQSQT